MNRWGKHVCLLAALWAPVSAQAAPRLDSATRHRANALNRSPASWQGESTQHGPSDVSMALIQAALSADPVALPGTRQRMMRAAQSHLDRCRRAIDLGAAPADRARSAFAYLHAHVLVGRYDPGCGRLQRTFDNGTHNCLTGSLIYLVLCREVGVSASAVASPGHVAVRIWMDDGAFDIETTDRRWQPQPAGQGRQNFVRIPDPALIGRVYYNLGIRFAHDGHLERALDATRLSYELDPSHEEARMNLLATLNNWSIELARRGEYDRAEALIREGRRIDDNYAPLRRSEAFLQQRHGRAPSL